VVVVVVV
jgi:hypothetical protein